MCSRHGDGAKGATNTMTDEYTPEEMQQISDAIYAGRKIEAIKLYREASGKDLKDSKDFVETLASKLREETPDKFAHPAGKSGCLVVLVLLLPVACATVYGLVI